MSLASTTQDVKRLQKTLQELYSTLNAGGLNAEQWTALNKQISLATTALERYKKAQSEFAASMRASQIKQDPNTIPEPKRLVGGPRYPQSSMEQGSRRGATPDSLAPNDPRGGIGESVLKLREYDKALSVVEQSLLDVGVKGAAAKKILESLAPQIKALPEAPTGVSFKGSTDGKNVRPSGFMFEEINPVAIENITAYNKVSGETAAVHRANAEAAREAAKAERDLAEAKRLEVLQTGARNDPTLAPVLAQAQKAGFGVDNLKNIRTEGDPANGIRLLEFSKIDPSGVVQKYNATISKLGDVLPEVGRKFRTFGQSVLRDIGELTKWSIAMAVIYGPIQKVSEITGLMIENEVKLAEATIAVNDALSSTDKIFNAAAEAANNAGEEINTTIAAFTAAYRATGGGANESERFATAQTLLADSMTLAKLAGMDESQAIDTLSAALRQQGSALTEGSTLLDKWVRTTQVANVDMNTLATGFAVMGETADAAGIDIDKLNGIIATVAETGLASGKEAANSARRVITAFQTPGAVAELQRLGIATEDANGKARSFLEIGQQIYEMRQKTGKDNTPLISDEAFSNLTLIAGQGVRGQAQLSAILGNFQRIAQVEQESKAAQGGEAAKALEKQLATAQTAITRFNNTFQEFAQTLGTKGGLLDLFKGLTNGGTELVKVLNSITGALGKATPMVTALTVAMIAFYRKPAETRAMYGQAFNGNVSNMVGSMLGVDMTKQVGTGGTTDSEALRAAQIRGFFNTRGKSAGLGGQVGYGVGTGVAAGVATSVIPAALNYAAGDKDKALADIGGGIAGGIAGAFIGGPMGATIGSSIGISIGEAFVSFTKPEINTWTFTEQGKIVQAPSQADLTTSEKKQAEIKRLQDKIMAGVGGGTANAVAWAANQNIDFINSKIASGENATAVQWGIPISKEVSGAMAAQGITKESIMSAKPGDKFNNLDAGQVAFALSLDEESKKILLKLVSEETASGNNPNVNPTRNYIDSKLGTGYSEVTKNAVSEMSKRLSEQYRNGEMKSTEYATKLGKAQGAFSGVEYLNVALGLDGTDIKKTEELFNLLTNGSTEALGSIQALATSIVNLGVAGKQGTEEYEGQKAALKKAIAEESLNVSLAQKPEAAIQNSVSNPYTSKSGVQAGIENARRLQRDYYSSAAGGNKTEDEMKVMFDRFDDVSFAINEGANLFYEVAKGLDPKFIAEGFKLAEKDGLLGTKQDGIDFQQFKDIDRATLEKLGAQSVSMGQEWKAKFNYGGKAEDQIAIAKDGVAKPLHADFKILAMLLEKLVDQGQKQLDGMFNMPDGAYFWVNLAAAQMHMATATAESIKNAVAGLTTGDGKLTPGTSHLTGKQDKNYDGTLIKDVGFKTPPMSGEKDAETVSKIKGMSGRELPDTLEAGKARASTSSGRTLPDTLQGMSERNVSSTAINTTLNLNLKSDTNITTSLLVDGRVLATVVMPYIKQFFASDLVKATTSTGNTTKDYVM